MRGRSVREKLITVVTINYNTADFIELMLYAFEKLTLNPYRVLICDNGSSDEELVKLAKVVQKYENVEVIFRVQSQAGSIGHAEALDLLIDKVNTKYTVVMDSDCTFLVKHWDQYMIDKIDDVVKIVGTTRQSKESQNDLVRKIYGDFPSPYAVLFDTSIYKKLQISCMPGDISKGEDTVWEWKYKYEKENYSGYSFEIINTRFTKNTPYGKTLCTAYKDNDTFIVAHFGRGSSGGEAKYKSWYYWMIPVLSKYFRLKKSMIEKAEWIEKSKVIIQNAMK